MKLFDIESEHYLCATHRFKTNVTRYQRRPNQPGLIHPRRTSSHKNQESICLIAHLTFCFLAHGDGAIKSYSRLEIVDSMLCFRFWARWMDYFRFRSKPMTMQRSTSGFFIDNGRILSGRMHGAYFLDENSLKLGLLSP